MIVRDIKINGVEKPVGFSVDKKVLSYKVDETESKKAISKKIVVSTNEDFSEIVFQKEGEEIKAKGTQLDFEVSPKTRYYCRVEIQGDKGDRAAGYTYFETGKMDEPWQGKWIAMDEKEQCHPIFRKKIKVEKPVKKARLYATGVGVFEAYVNGEKLGNEFLAPFNSHYETYLETLTFEVNNIKEGENELSFLLGKGWFLGEFGLEGTKENYGDRMAVIGELVLEYTDGQKDIIYTDDSFEYKASDIEESGIYYGETINRLLWSDETKNPWKKAIILENVEKNKGTENLAKNRLKDRNSPRLTCHEQMKVKEIITTKSGETVLDFGQNFAGLIKFNVDFEKGTKIVLDFGEILQDGDFYRENYREANSQFVYISGGKKETVEPHFTYFGYRYVRVTGWPREVSKDDFVGEALYSEMTQTGFISTSNEKINQLISNTMWGLKSNFMDLPTDCPQRNERLGWTGDAQVFAPTACYHMDTRAFYNKFVTDLRGEQRFLDGGIPNYIPNIGHKDDCASVWGDVATFLPTTVYKMFGDISELERSYNLMKDWVDYIDRRDGKRGEKKYLFDFGFQFGDWLALDGATEESFKGSTEDAYIGSIYYYQSADMVAKAAKELGKEEDAKHYEKLAKKIKDAVLDEYVTANGRLAVDTQSSYIIALKFGIYRDRNRMIEQFKTRLKKDGYKIRCGFVGAPLLCTVLAENGMIQEAYDFLLNEAFPSWLYCVNLGATTVWERWNSVMPDGSMSKTGMNSLNHYSYGSVMEFVYAYAAGIRPLENGFEKAIIAPNPNARLPKIQCTYDSVSGKYVCNTEICADGKVVVDIEIPFECEAKVILPGYKEKEMELSAGKYHFEYIPENDLRKIFNESTPISKLVKNEKALQILQEKTPMIAGMAMGGNPEFENNGLAEFKYLSFLPIKKEDLEDVIAKISDINVVEK